MATIQVNNWDEFVTAVGTSGATVECPANAVWDINDVSPAGVAKTEIKCSKINGNGLKIENLRCTQDYLFVLGSRVECSDLYFLNFYLGGGFYDGDANLSRVWRGCRFEGLSTSSGIVFRGAGYYNAGTDLFTTSPNTNKGCGFNIICQSGTLFSGYNTATTKIENGNIKFNGKSLSYAASGSSTNVGFNNCLISGEFQDALSVASDTVIFDCNCNKITDYNGFSRTIVNKDKCPSYPSSAIAVTTEQISDASYLQSKGFPIGA